MRKSQLQKEKNLRQCLERQLPPTLGDDEVGGRVRGLVNVGMGRYRE